MTRFALAAILGAWAALVAWVLWVLAHAPDDTEQCELCGEPMVRRPRARVECSPADPLALGAKVRYPGDPHASDDVGTVVPCPGYAANLDRRPGEVWVQWPELDFPLPYMPDELVPA